MPPSSSGTDEQAFAAAGRNAVGDHATAEDSLGFGPYVESIAAFLTSAATEPPLTMSIEGEWGSGKSSFMLQLERAIAGPSRRAVFFKELPTMFGGYTTPGSVWTAVAKARSRHPPPTIRFNAWRHDKQDALWAAFALSVSRQLRKRVGFRRAWSGDARLFLSRLSGMRGWMELCLLLLSILLLLLSLPVLYESLVAHTAHHSLGELIGKGTSLVNPWAKKDPATAESFRRVYESLLSRETATHGSWLAIFTLAITGFVKFHKQLKLPISVDLKKYLSAPDYKEHPAFIESFHEDFARLLRAYAGNERVFVFIDDLDRCDVPRAAELMQAINLMIGDAGRLIFVLGMDREKVAAGITQKYKDLLPFLPEYAAGMPSLGQQTGAGSSPLAFGYSYLEKFIQLSFTLPVIAGRESMERFLDGMLPKAPGPTWRGQVTYYWAPKIRSVQSKFRARPATEPASGTSPLGVDEPPPVTARRSGQAASDAESIRTEKRVRNLRLQIAKESEGVRGIVAMVSPMFENNPRRLKQFLSTLRLALALSSEQGILDLDPAKTGVTPQQLGKFVALTMKYPDLRVALVENPELLGVLEDEAREWDEDAPPASAYWRWLHRKTVRSVLRYGVRQTELSVPLTEAEPNPYSLMGLDVSRLMSLLPKVPPPEPLPDAGKPAESPLSSVDEQAEASPGVDAPSGPTRSREPFKDALLKLIKPAPAPVESGPPGSSAPTMDELQSTFDVLAQNYEAIRKSQRASNQRTANMTSLVHDVQARVGEFSPEVVQRILSEQLANGGDGNRMVALGIACERVRQENLPWLLDYLRKFRSPFEHYWTIRALLLHERFLDPDSARSVYETLSMLWDQIEKDRGRSVEARDLMEAAEKRFGAGAEVAF